MQILIYSTEGERCNDTTVYSHTVLDALLSRKVNLGDFDLIYLDQNLWRKKYEDNPDMAIVKKIENDDEIIELDYVISLGGDGTFVSAVRKYHMFKPEFIGINVNRKGRLGFLTPFVGPFHWDTDKLIDFFEQLFHHDVCLKQQRNLLNMNYTHPMGKEFNYKAVNEFAVKNPNSHKLISLDCYIQNEHIGTYRADGVILTGPTGSTAYSLSCGGPILEPNAPVLCITPIVPFTMTFRPLIISDDNVVTIKEKNKNPIQVIIDGQEIIDVPADFIYLSKSLSYTSVLPPDYKFFEQLKNKLLWSKIGE